VPASVGHGNGPEENRRGVLPWTVQKKAQRSAHKDKFHQDVTDAITSKVVDFIQDVHESDQEENNEIMMLKASVEELKRMLQDQIHHRVGIERRLDERCDRMDITIASLKSYDPMKDIAMLHDRVDALENGVGAATDRTTRELEALQGGHKGLRMELDVAREAVQSYATAVEVIERSLRDVASKADGISKLKEEADETHKKFVSHLEGSLNNALAALHGNIVASDQGHAAFRDEVRQRFGSVQEHLDGSVNEALMVAKARLDQTNTRLDSYELQCAEVAGSSSQFADRVGKMEENLQGVADGCLALRDSIQHIQGEVKAQQDNFGGVRGLQQNINDCQGQCDKLEEHCVSLMETTRALETKLQDSGNTSSEDLQVVMAHVKDLYGILDTHQSGLKDLVADEARAREINHSAVHDRVDALDRRHNDLESLARDLGHHRERIDGAFQTLAANMASELKSSRDDIEQVHAVMLTVQQAWGSKTRTLRNKKQQDIQRQPISLMPMGL